MTESAILPPDRLGALLDAFAGRSVIVTGDLMLDAYVWGRVNRISPEAPVMVVEEQETTHCMGGAGNVASNVRAMGGEATLCGAVGDDEDGQRLLAHARTHGIRASGVLTVAGRVTTVKTRIVAHSQQVVRVDRETREPLPADAGERIVGSVRAAIPRMDAMVLSDYAKGLLRDDVARACIAIAREHGRPVVVNLKPPRVQPFAGATLIALNHHETERAIGRPLPDEAAVFEAGNELRHRLSCDGLLVTRGPDGVCLFTADAGPLCLPARRVEVFDVAGAGDTVIAAAAMALASGASLAEAAALGNLAGNVKVTKLGVSTVSREEIRRMAERA